MVQRLKFDSLVIILLNIKDIRAACLDLAIKMHIDLLFDLYDLYLDSNSYWLPAHRSKLKTRHYDCNEESMLACQKVICTETNGKIFPYAIDKTISAICNYLLLEYSICTKTLWGTTCAGVLIEKATSIFTGCFYRPTGCCIWKIIITACVLSLRKYAACQDRDSLSIVESRLIQILQKMGILITEEELKGLKDEVDTCVVCTQLDPPLDRVKGILKCCC